MPAWHIKETDADIVACCPYLVLSASPRLCFSSLQKVGQSLVLMTIFGRVLCPLQPSCLPPQHAARALMLNSFTLVVYLHFLGFLLLLLVHCHQNRALFNPLLVFLYAHTAPYPSILLLLSPAHPGTALFCLLPPNPLHPLILLFPASPLFTAPFVLPLHITSCVLLFSLILLQQEAARVQVRSNECEHGAGSAGPWPILAPSLCS